MYTHGVGKEETLAKIINDLKNHRFAYSIHALARMAEREIEAIDIHYLINSHAINNHSWSEDHQSWNFTGYGLAENPFTIACCYEDDGTLIVTVFWE